MNEEEFVRKIGKMLDDSLDEVSPHVVRRLESARNRAVASMKTEVSVQSDGSLLMRRLKFGTVAVLASLILLAGLMQAKETCLSHAACAEFVFGTDSGQVQQNDSQDD